MDKITITSGSAITILNGIKSDFASTLGIESNTWIEITKSEHYQFTSNQEVDDKLIISCINLLSKRFKKISFSKASIYTRAEFLHSRGIKTSSSISNSICLGLVKLFELDNQITTSEVLKLAAKASIKAGVSITGAIDDAFASYYGGLVVTKNRKMEIIKQEKIPKNLVEYQVMLLIPDKMNIKQNIQHALKQVNKELLIQAKDAIFENNLVDAIKFNTLAYGPLLSVDYNLIEIMRNSGYIVGLNGAGPTLFVLLKPEQEQTFLMQFKKNLRIYRVIKKKFRDLQNL